VTTKLQGTLDEAVKCLRAELDLLIIINESSSMAHEAIARAIGSQPIIDPFVLARRGFERSVRAFAPKFASIKRNHRLLYGADPLAGLAIEAGLEKFLCEQAVRNLRLRLIYSFVTRQQHKAYDKFVMRNITGIFVQFSEALRLNGSSIPTEFDARIPVLEKEFKADGQVLRDLLELKKNPRKFSEVDAVNWHARLFPVVDAVLGWMELNWPAR
jgi:hypothetical protein